MAGGAGAIRSQRAEANATRLMGVLFGVGAMCFVVGPLDAYVARVGAHADAVTFFIGSILFTAGGLTQSWLAYPERRAHRAGLFAWRAAWIQSVGTVLFNFMTFEAISLASANGQYNVLVWTPNALGSVCFLGSGVLLYLSVPRVGWRAVRRPAGWWEPPLNLLGCVLFGVSAATGYAVSSAGRLLDLTTANWTTTFGAACFLAVALPPMIAGMSFKVPRLSRLAAFERALQHELATAGRKLEADVRRTADVVERGVEAADVQLRETLARVQGLAEGEPKFNA